jgi:hypothetical protein
VALQAGILCLLSAFAVAAVLLFGKGLSLLQSYVHPPVVPRLDAVALPRHPIDAGSSSAAAASSSRLRRKYGTNGRRDGAGPSPVWGMNLQVPSLPVPSSSSPMQGDFKRRINPIDQALYEQDRIRVLLGDRPSGSTGTKTAQHQQEGGDDEEERYVPSDQLDQPRACQRTAWRSRFYPVCNTFHEIFLDRPYGGTYDHRFQRSLGIDAYEYMQRTSPSDLTACIERVISHPCSASNLLPFCRSTNSDRWEWVLTPNILGMEASSLVLEQLSLRRVDENDPRAYRQRQVQAIVSERFASSPRVVSTFGYCGLDLLFERTKGSGGGGGGGAGTSLLQRYRPYSGTEALDVAIGIAESVADLHGFAGGVIVHGQLELSLFRRVNLPAPAASAEPGWTVQLTDVTAADFLDWDPNQEAYCDAAPLSGSVETVRTLIRAHLSSLRYC